MLALDAAGNVVSSNASAQQLVKRKKGLRLIGERLTCDDEDAAHALTEAVARAAARGDFSPTLVRCRRPLPATALQLLVSRIPSGSDTPAAADDPPAVALVIVSDPSAAPLPAADALQPLFGLTPTQARLAAAIAAGKTVKEFADQHEVTEGTARMYLKELMARVGVRRQPELVRSLLSGVAQLRTVTDSM